MKYTPDWGSIWPKLDMANKLYETPCLLTKEEQRAIEGFVRKPHLKKYKNITPEGLANFSVERVIQTVHAYLDEKDAISEEGRKISEKIKAYMIKRGLKTVLIDSKKHGRLLVNFDRFAYSWRQLSYSSNPGAIKNIDGKDYYILSWNLPDKVISSSRLFDKFASRQNVWGDFLTKYSGLLKNLHYFLKLEEHENEDFAPKEPNAPIVLSGAGEGLILIPDGRSRSYSVKRIGDVTIKI